MLAEAKLDAITAIYQRRAVRSYTAENIEKSAIDELIDAAVHAPTAVHREPWAFAVIQNKERLRQYSDGAKSLLLAQQEAKSFFQAAEPQALAVLHDPSFNIFYDAGTLIVICARPLGNFVTADCWLAAENLMLAAAALGLGTCCIGFAVPVMNTAEVKRELGIGADVTAVAPIIVGVPATAPVPPPRKTPEVLSWIR